MENSNEGENRLDSRGYKVGKRSETSRLNGLLGGRPQNIDYDSDEFYDYVFQQAANAATIEELPTLIYNKYKVAIHPEDFKDMLAGRYDGWSEEENERRSTRLSFAIKRAKKGQIYLIRSLYLKTAMGGKPIETTSVTKRKLKIDGVYTDDEEVSTTTTKSVTQPNMAALATWLYHYDDDWRRVQRGLIPRDAAQAEKEAQEIQEEQGSTSDGGVDIGAWIQKECELNSLSDVPNEEDVK